MAAFSDGVFAIAATLFVLDLAVHPPGTPLQRVLHGWPGYVASVVGFLTIGGAWLLHTALTERLTRADPILAPSPHSRRETPDHALE
jgi:TMEM175 potassium channel family protein